MRYAALATAVLAAALSLGCQSVVAGLGRTDGSPAAKAEDLFGALSVRFGVAYRDSRFESIRPRMIRHALTPSRLFSDTAIWTSTDGGVRTVTVAGEVVGDRYVLAARGLVARPDTPGESRHVMHLRRLGDGVHQWDSTDELAIGTIRAAELFSVLEAAVRGLEQPADEVRRETRAAFPRTMAVLGRLFVLDTLRTTLAEDGSTAITIGARLDAQRLRPTAPRYAEYVEEYLRPLRIDIALTDATGIIWGTAAFRRNLLEVRIRSRDGVLLPLAGDAAARPDSLHLRISFFAKVLFFEVGATNLIAEVVPARDAAVRGWALRFRREPRWHFPLAVSRLLRAPLRRPFANEGAMVEYIARDTVGGQTMLARNIHIVVQESAIVRWLGALGATAMGDLSTEAEQEKDRFVGEVFRAMADDVRLLLPH